MNIQIEQNESKGAVYIENEGKRLAEMTYSVASPQLVIIDHTEVDDSLRGSGIGKKLLGEIIAKARKEDFRIIPLCPFAKSVFEKDESIRDVLR